MAETIRFHADRRRIRVVLLLLVLYAAFFWWWYRDDPVWWMLVPIVASGICAAGIALLDLVLAFRPILEVGDETVRWRSPWIGGWRRVRYEQVRSADWRVDVVGLETGPDRTAWMPLGSLRRRDRQRVRTLLDQRLDVDAA